MTADPNIQEFTLYPPEKVFGDISHLRFLPARSRDALISPDTPLPVQSSDEQVVFSSQFIFVSEHANRRVLRTMFVDPAKFPNLNVNLPEEKVEISTREPLDTSVSEADGSVPSLRLLGSLAALACVATWLLGPLSPSWYIRSHFLVFVISAPILVLVSLFVRIKSE